MKNKIEKKSCFRDAKKRFLNFDRIRSSRCWSSDRRFLYDLDLRGSLIGRRVYAGSCARRVWIKKQKSGKERSKRTIQRRAKSFRWKVHHDTMPAGWRRRERRSPDKVTDCLRRELNWPFILWVRAKKKRVRRASFFRQSRANVLNESLTMLRYDDEELSSRWAFA